MPRSAPVLASACFLALALVVPARAQDDTRDTAPGADDLDPNAPTLTEEGEEIIERTPSKAPGAGLDVEGIPERTGDDRRFIGRIRTEFAEVMAGPGAAYISRGRVYQNDRVQVLRRNDAGDWLEVEINGLRGWVRVRYLEIQRAPGAEATLDAGRDRRRTNYGYDERGRRLRPDGTAFGSGEGTEEVPGTSSDEAPDEVPEEVQDTSSGLRLAPYVAVGIGQIRRVFDSDIVKPSPLSHQTAQPLGMSMTLGLDWDPLRFLRVGARFDGSFLGSTDIPRNPELGFQRPVTLAISGWRAGLDALGRYPVGPAWIGGYGGLRVFRQNFQETAGYPLFLTNTLWTAALGGAAGITFGPGLELSGRGGYNVPLSISQSPADSGDLQSGGGYELGLGGGWHLSRRFTALIDVYFARHRLEFAGASSQKQTFNDEETAGKDPVGYEHARETDTIQGAGLGIRGAL